MNTINDFRTNGHIPATSSKVFLSIYSNFSKFATVENFKLILDWQNLISADAWDTFSHAIFSEPQPALGSL